MRKALKLTQQIKFQDLMGNVTQAKLMSIQDKLSIIREGPWSFNKHLVLTNEVDGTQKVHQL